MSTEIKYVDSAIVLEEIPDELTLAINISNCPIKCDGCHSPFLWEDTGTELTEAALDDLISNNSGITCVAFMGGDANPSYINDLAAIVKNNYNLKSAWYSGNDSIPDSININNFDYIKIGRFIKKLGGLRSSITNQILYQIQNSKLVPITYKLIQ